MITYMIDNYNCIVCNKAFVKVCCGKKTKQKNNECMFKCRASLLTVLLSMYQLL